MTSKEAMLKIGLILCDGNEEVAQEIKMCMEATKPSYQDPDVDIEILRWYGMVDILQEHKIVCILDHREFKEYFVEDVEECVGFEKYDLTIKEDELDEDGNIEKWIDVVNKHWNNENSAHLAIIWTGNDSYALVPVRLTDLEKLKGLANDLGKLKDFADEWDEQIFL